MHIFQVDSSGMFTCRGTLEVVLLHEEESSP
jgi:hypothetical protein